MKNTKQYISRAMLAILALAATATLSAQVLTTPLIQTFDPTGNCTVQTQQIVVNTANQKLFICNSVTGLYVSSGTASGSTGTGASVLQTSPTIITPVIATITNTGTVTLPTTTGGLPVVIACGSTTTGTANCANTAVGATGQIYFGKATLASNTQTITLSPGYTSSSTFYCVGNDVTTRANPVQVVPASATTVTVTNTTGASDVVQWICVGN